MIDAIEFKTPRESDALTVRWNGLCHLNETVLKQEAQLLQGYSAEELLCQDEDETYEESDPLLLNYFLWYSMTAYAFLTLFYKTYLPDPDKRGWPGWAVEKEFPDLVKWRHKVGAHHSFVCPGKDPTTKDTELTQLVSLLLNVHFAFNVRRFYVVGAILNDKEKIKLRWSLTKEHERIWSFCKQHLPT